jgi:Phycobilisome degradation protein nblA
MLPPLKLELTMEQLFELRKIESQAAKAPVYVLQEAVVELSRQLMLTRSVIAEMAKAELRQSLGIEEEEKK